jgi:hypothetical protein
MSEGEKALIKEAESKDVEMGSDQEEEKIEASKKKTDDKQIFDSETNSYFEDEDNGPGEALGGSQIPKSEVDMQDQTSQGSMKLIEQLLLENSELRKTNEDNISEIGKLNEMVDSITKDSQGADYANRSLCNKIEDQEAKISALKEENKALTKRVIKLENDVRLLNAKLKCYESTQKAEVAANLEAKVLADIEARFEAKLKTQQKDLESKMEALTKKVGSLDLKEDK